MELEEPADTIMRVTVRKKTYHTMTIAYRWWPGWGRVVVCCIVIECLDVPWMLHFTMHSLLRAALLMDAFTLLVITSHMGVLK